MEKENIHYEPIMADKATTADKTSATPLSEGAALRERLEKGELRLEDLQKLNAERTAALKAELIEGLTAIRERERSGTPLTAEEKARKESLISSAIRLRDSLVWYAEARSVVFEQTGQSLDVHLQNVEKSFRILEESRKDAKGLSAVVEEGKGRKFETRGEDLGQKELNLASFTKVLEGRSSETISTLAERLKKAQSEGSQKAFEIIKNELGYKFNSWILVNDEAKEFVRAVERVASYSKAGPSKMLEFLVDEDWSGHVLAAKDSREGQIYHVLSDPSRDSGGFSGEAKIAKVIERVTGKPVSGFDADPIGYKSLFLRELNLRLSYGIPLSTIAKGKIADYRKEQRQVYENVAKNLSPEERKKIDDAIENHPKLKEIVASLDPESRETLFDRIRLAAVGISLGSNTVIGAAFDISKATNGIIDGFVVGLLNGQPMFGISKTIARAKDGSWTVDATLGFSSKLGLAPGIRVSSDTMENDKGTAGIRRMVNAQANMFDAVGEDLVSGSAKISEKTVETVTKGLADPKEKEAVIAKLEEMRATLERFMNDLGAKDPEDRKALLAGMRHAYLSQVELTANTLKTNDGTTFVGLAPDLLGLLRITSGAVGILLFVLGSLKFERFAGVKHKESKSASHQFAEAVTGKQKLEAAGERIDNFRSIDPEAPDFVVLRVPMDPKDVDRIVGSAPIQVEKGKDCLYVSGDMSVISKMTYLNFSSNESVSRVLYFGEPREENGRITYFEPAEKITRSITRIPSAGRNADKSASNSAENGIATKNEFAPEVRDALAKIGNRISRRTIMGSATARELQSSIYALLNGKGNLDKTYASAAKLLKSKGIALPAGLDVSAKLAVLERVYGAFMKDVYLEGKPATAETYEKSKAALRKRLVGSGLSSFVDSVDKAPSKTPFISRVPESTPENGYLGDAARAYVFLSMGMKEFDAFGGRRGAFEQRMVEFSGTRAEDAKSIRDAVQVSYAEYASKMPEGGHFVPENYDGKSLVTFPVSSQIDKNGKSLHKGMAPILGSVVVARRGNGGEDNFVPLQNDALRRSMVDRLPNPIISKLAVRLGLDPSATDTDSNVRSAMKEGTAINGSKIEFDAVFFKWGDCFNDAIGMKNLRISGGGVPGVQPGPVTIDKAESSVTTPSLVDGAPLGIYIGGNAGKKIEDVKTSSNPNPNPNPGGPGGTTTPGVSAGSGNTGVTTPVTGGGTAGF
ncbi:MAG: Peptidoglycan-binding protein [Patescibacteria group bacterium]|nr:Peptidoglycan-binding protein [Patescibacteria group bacterium]